MSQIHEKFFDACHNGDYNGVEIVCENLSVDDVLQSDEVGNTALLYACMNGNANIIDLLVTYGANIDDYNMYEESCLITAVRGGHYDAVRSLVWTHGANPDWTNRNGETALDVAIKCNHYKIAEYLDTVTAIM